MMSRQRWDALIRATTKQKTSRVCLVVSNPAQASSLEGELVRRGATPRAPGCVELGGSHVAIVTLDDRHQAVSADSVLWDDGAHRFVMLRLRAAIDKARRSVRDAHSALDHAMVEFLETDRERVVKA